MERLWPSHFGRLKAEVGEAGESPACDGLSAGGIFPQYSGGQYGVSPWTATLRRDSDSHSTFAARSRRTPQIDTRRRVTSADAEEVLRDFLERYPPRPYRRRGAANYPAAELATVTDADGLLYLNEVPAQMPKGAHGDPTRMTASIVICGLSTSADGRALSQEPLHRLGPGKLHHTNLTGGGKASIGGEIWFGELPLIYLSGSSRRYPPEEEAHLKNAERLFRAVGFDVRSLGWDPETHRPLRVWLER